MTPIESAAELAKRASEQNDRFLFIFTILLLGGGVLLGLRMVAKYFIKQHEGLIADFREDRKAASARIAQIYDEERKSIEEIYRGRIATLHEFNEQRQREHAEFVRCVDNCTQAINRNTACLEEVKEVIKRCPNAKA